jgi:hypothetical protein
VKFATERIGDHRIDIEVDGSGQFTAEFNDCNYSHATRLGLLEELKKAVRRAELQGVVDVTVLGLVAVSNAHKRHYSNEPYEPGAGVVQAKLRGKHERQHATWLLVADEGKPRFQVSGYARDNVQIARRLTVVEIKQYLALRETVRVATCDLEDFIGSVKIDPAAALEGARKAEA